MPKTIKVRVTPHVGNPAIKSSNLIFKSFPHLVAAFSARQFKNMSLFYGYTQRALVNRQKFLSRLGIDYRDLICAKQIHASHIKYAKEPDKGKGAFSYRDAISNTDALITDKKNLPLAIFTADCLSIFLYDRKTPAVGLLHAGWRSTREYIAAKAVKQMQKEFGSSIKNMRVGFGPAIRSCCYEVGESFGGFFSDGLIKRKSRYYLDLIRINKIQLLDLGVKEKNIFDSGICTSCQNKDFFSYRKEGNACGRIMSVIMLK